MSMKGGGIENIENADLAGNRIACTVWIREGIEKCIHRSLEQFDKGFFHRVLPRTTKHRVLQDVRDAS